MTKDFKRFYVSRAMFLGATMFLASIGIATANPSTDALGSAEPNPVVASPQQDYVLQSLILLSLRHNRQNTLLKVW